MTEQCLPWHTACHVDAAAIPGDLSAQQLREMTTRLLTELRHSQALCAKLTHECQSASNSFQVSASKFFQLLRLI